MGLSSYDGSTLLWLMGRGMNLSRCAEFTRERIAHVLEEERKLQASGKQIKYTYFNAKRPEEIARILVNGCAQSVVADRIAAEWDLLGSGIRMEFTELADAGRRSGNKDKGLLRLDKALGGKIFRREVERYVVTRAPKVRRDDVHPEFRTMHDGSRSAIEWKFARMPSDYDKWSPAKKKAYREQLARERRASR